MTSADSGTAAAPAALPRHDGVVLAGGAARRLGGVDKPGLRVGGHTLLDIAVAACADAERVVVVGPERTTERSVRWVREDPPGGGPVAATAAALPLVEAPVVVLLAADQPFVTADVVRRLRRALADTGADGCLLLDATGRSQPLLAAYRRAALATRVAALAAEAGGQVEGAAPLDGVSMRALLRGLRVVGLPASEVVAAPAGTTAATDPGFDCDTWDDVRHARDVLTGRMGRGTPGTSG